MNEDVLFFWTCVFTSLLRFTIDSFSYGPICSKICSQFVHSSDEDESLPKKVNKITVKKVHLTVTSVALFLLFKKKEFYGNREENQMHKVLSQVP